MKVLVIPAKKGGIHEQDVPNELNSLQEFVGGYIEAGTPAQLREEGICLLCNEEGLLKGLDPNENLYPFFYVGQCVMVGVAGDDFAGLTDPQLRFIYQWFISSI